MVAAAGLVVWRKDAAFFVRSYHGALCLLKEQNIDALPLRGKLGLNGEKDNARQLVRNAGAKVTPHLHNIIYKNS